MSDAQSTFAERAGDWLHSHDTGISSQAIFHFMALNIKDGGTPSDPADLARCLRLLEEFPEWKARMWEMKTVSAAWARLMPRWDEIVSMFHQEAGDGWKERWGDWNAPKTYDLMCADRYEEPGVVHIVLGDAA